VRAYKKKRLENAIAYMIKIQTHFSGQRAFQTFIYSYLALIDFKALKEAGKPVFDLDYVATIMGPVPIELDDNRDKIVDDENYFDAIKLVRDQEGNYWYACKQEPDLDYLSDYEIELIEATVEEFAGKGIKTTSEEVVDASCVRIRAWHKAWENRGDCGRVPINPLHTFIDLLQKKEEEFTPVEETALYYEAMKKSQILPS